MPMEKVLQMVCQYVRFSAKNGNILPNCLLICSWKKVATNYDYAYMKKMYYLCTKIYQ